MKNESVSMNASLAEGISDGVVKKAAPDRGGRNAKSIADEDAVKAQLQQQYDAVYSSGTAAASRLTNL